MMMKLDYRNVPTYYLNLDDEPHRIKKTEDSLRSSGIVTFTRCSAIKSNVKKLGCSASHHKILGDFSIKTPFMICEDDLIYTGINKFVYDLPEDADALYLGPTQWSRYMDYIGPFLHYKLTDSPDVVRIYNMLMAHAVIYISDDYRKHCERIARLSMEGKYHIDQGFAEAQRIYNVYSVNHPVFSQSGWNQRVTSSPVTEVGIESKDHERFFNYVKDNLNVLDGVSDLTIVSKSKYYPMGYDGVGIPMPISRGEG